MNHIINADAIRIQGVVETAEIIGDDVKSHTCENCGHIIKVSGGIILNESFECVDNQQSIACQKCRGVIRLT